MVIGFGLGAESGYVDIYTCIIFMLHLYSTHYLQVIAGNVSILTSYEMT